MKQLSDHDSNVILINVFTVEPSNQQRLVQLLTRATDNAVSRARLDDHPGGLSTHAMRAQGKCRSRSQKKILQLLHGVLTENSPTRRDRPHS
jgi:hypothetical protein